MNLVIIRHGKSVWNLENKFTGWYDIELAPEGMIEAEKAASFLADNEFKPDVCFTSYLQRANKTLEIILNHMPVKIVKDIEIIKSWKLNERHYGALQGLNKDDTKNKYGEQKFLEWRRSYNIPPPILDEDSTMNPKKDPIYENENIDELPLTECLKDTYDRVVPYWTSEIKPLILEKDVMIAAHGNSLRALCKFLFDIEDDDIVNLEIPTGNPLLINLDKSCKILSARYLDSSRAENLPKI